MIKKFKSKALDKLYNHGSAAGIPPASKIRILALLDLLEAAQEPKELAMPGTGYHSLKGDRKGQHSMTVTANWRLVFEFDGEAFTKIDLEDYH
jgi:proteic killer suppression protein